MQTTLACFEDILKELTENIGVSINFHDIYGISKLNKDFAAVINKYQLHHNSFCDTVKRTPLGLGRCINCKNKAVAKVQKDNKPYYGYCYMGLGEFVYPVIFKDKLIAVLFIGECTDDVGNHKKQLITNAEEMGLDTVRISSLYNEVTKPLSSVQIDDKVQLLIKMFQLFLYESGYKFTDAVYENHLVESAMSFINTNYAMDLSLELISSSCHCNPTYLSRVFKESTGVNISEYINRVRVEAAKTALRFTDKSVTEIAYQAGFSDTAYFSKVFKKIEGVTPKEYKNLEDK